MIRAVMIAAMALILSAGPAAAANDFLSGKTFHEKCGAVPLLKNGMFDEKKGDGRPSKRGCFKPGSV
jgi:hypothetical protein